jgi:hypothetical protein
MHLKVACCRLGYTATRNNTVGKLMLALRKVHTPVMYSPYGVGTAGACKYYFDS